ncbi:DUF4153 domain-containing protein [Paludibacter sp.]|uniref:DUF4153 domain-containing protein n=1 Tax=Paludibacter sp. TaxID=1898105 RepID=UPI0013529ADE|nr:DUF4153 domain-containing protein [Paludibacter sp.]MTK53398.1 DUF4153 domain-containing protein [Paludibacter sp.]
MKLYLFKNWNEKLKLVLVRFPLSLLLVLGTSVLFVLKIHDYKVEISEFMWPLFLGGIFLSIATTLLCEEMRNKLMAISVEILVVVIWLVYCLTLPKHLQAVHIYQVVVISVSFALSIFFIAFLKKAREIPFWNFVYNIIVLLLVTYLFASVLMGGLGLALLSLDKLFHVVINEKVYGYLNVFCFVIFAPVYWLASIPYADDKFDNHVQFNKVLKILGLYILLPILCIYLSILYVYMFQIIAKWELPNGWVSTLVSALGIGGLLTIIILYPLRVRGENKIVVWQAKYFPLVLLPLLVLMFIAIVRRLDDYGTTINRLYVLLLNLWLFGVSIWLFIVQSKYIKWIVVSFALVAFLSSVGPWSIGNVTKHSLQKELKNRLSGLHLLEKGGTVKMTIPVMAVDSISRNRIAEITNYLVETYGNESLQYLFASPVGKMSSREIINRFGMQETSSKTIQSFDAWQREGTWSAKVAPYSTIVAINKSFTPDNPYEDENVVLQVKGAVVSVQTKTQPSKQITISLESKLQQFVNAGTEKRNKYTKDEMTLNGPNYRIIILSVSGDYNRKTRSFHVGYLKAYLMY